RLVNDSSEERLHQPEKAVPSGYKQPLMKVSLPRARARGCGTPLLSFAALFRRSSVVERAAVNRMVVGSNPTAGATLAGSMTMKLTASMMLTLDGVYQGPGGPDEDRRGGFDRGGWTAAHADEEGWAFLTSYFERADAFLLGRKTWEIWEPYWPHHDSGDPVSHGINVLPKYVPSATLKDPAWQNTHVISGDVEAAVRELKAKPGRELQVHGSGALLRWLLDRDLVDELNL